MHQTPQEKTLVITMLILLALCFVVIMITTTALNQTFNKPIQSHNSSGYNQ